VTEHDDRVLCAVCLKKSAAASRPGRRSAAIAFRFIQCAIGLLTAWFFFFLIGELLVRIPSAFHNDVLWRTPRTRQE
jgi:hypothetical protein